MPSTETLDRTYLELARVWSQLSPAQRMKVGCLIVKDNMIISDGYNGTPSGFDNTCEGEDGKTLTEVLHAESNAITKLAKSTQSSYGATVYITLSPCVDCAKIMIQSGINRVVYGERYRHADRGLDLLARAGIPTILIS